MAVHGYTKNYKLIKPEFNSDTWHDYEYENLDTIDAVLSAIYASGQWRGFWKNDTLYHELDVVIDRNTDTMYKVVVEHTTDNNVTFAEYMFNHPEYYQLWSPNNLAKDWAIKDDGLADNQDYSAKAYAIGGVGTETNNAKYYSEQAAAQAEESTEQASASASSANAAYNSEQLALSHANDSAESASDSALSAEQSANSAEHSQEQAELSQSHAEYAADEVAGLEDFTREKQAEILASVNAALASAEEARRFAAAAQGGNIGDIGIAPFGIDESLNLRRYLNGQVISQSQFQSFTTKIKRAVELFPNLSATEENWQAELALSKLGQCGKFVIDDEAGTIRLPKAVNINSLQDLALIGGIKAESLPNITGALINNSGAGVDVGGEWNEGGFTQTGALRTESKTTNYAINSNSWNGGQNLKSITFDASLSSSTYQDGTPVQQEAVQYPYFIQVATGVEETLPAISEYKLNNPNFFGQSMWTDVTPNNASWLLSNGAFHSGATYTDYYEWLLEQRNANLKTVYLWKSTIDEQIMFVTETDTLSVGTTLYGYMPTAILGEIVGISGNDVTIKNDVTNQVYTQSIDVANPISSIVYLYDPSKINVISKQELDYWTIPTNTSDYDFVINTADQTFRLPLDTRLASGKAVKGNGMTLGLTNGEINAGLIGGSGDGNEGNSVARLFKLNYGTPVGAPTPVTGTAIGLSVGVTTDPSKSGIETASDGLKLYFYVGDTLQDPALINAGRALNDIAELRGRTHIVETYRNGTSWYRIWSDGWCEQGGATTNGVSAPITIMLPKPFKDNLYSVQVTINGTGGVTSNSYIILALGKTETSFRIENYSSGSGANNYYQWEAKGYIR